MTAKKPFPLIPTLLMVASSLTLVACSDSGTSSNQQTEQPTSLLDKAEQATQDMAILATETNQAATEAVTSAVNEVKEEVKTASDSAVETAKTTVQESIATASAVATQSAKTVTEKAATATNNAKTSVNEATAKVAETSSSAVKAVTEKAAETKTAITSKVAALAPAAATSNQAEMLELAKSSGCLSCHSVEKKIVGPAWRDVAAKYRGQSDAKTNIIASITKGSTGKWGTFAMPANSPRVSDENIATLAGFVLSLE